MKRIDQWIVPSKIYDAHHHFFSYEGLEKRAIRMGYNNLEKMVKDMGERTKQIVELPDPDITKFLEKWVKELDNKNVDKSMIFPDWNDLKFVEMAMKHHPDRFIPFLMINPKEDGAFELLEEGYSKYGIKGFKLYPPLNYYHAYEEFLSPFYEFANDHKMLITYHMGISIGSMADIRYMNPADVSPIARDYSKTNFLFAHFATGYLQELLFLMYHVDNVYAETSSSNRWMDFMAFDINLQQVFERVIKASGTDHIIFGTDSTSFPRGWRKPIYDTQLAVCNAIGLNQEQVDQIFYKNLENLVSNVG